MPTKQKNKNLKDEVPAFVDIYATLERCNTDPAQYKPYNPSLIISNARQSVLVHLQVPSEEVESTIKLGKSKVYVITAEGMTLMLRRLATEMQTAIQGG